MQIQSFMTDLWQSYSILLLLSLLQSPLHKSKLRHHIFLLWRNHEKQPQRLRWHHECKELFPVQQQLSRILIEETTGPKPHTRDTKAASLSMVTFSSAFLKVAIVFSSCASSIASPKSFSFQSRLLGQNSQLSPNKMLSPRVNWRLNMSQKRRGEHRKQNRSTWKTKERATHCELRSIRSCKLVRCKVSRVWGFLLLQCILSIPLIHTIWPSTTIHPLYGPSRLA